MKLLATPSSVDAAFLAFFSFLIIRLPTSELVNELAQVINGGEVCDLAGEVGDPIGGPETAAGQRHPQRLPVHLEEVERLLDSSLVAHQGQGEAVRAEDDSLVLVPPLGRVAAVQAEAEADL
jgi:hypothetical protein